MNKLHITDARVIAAIKSYRQNDEQGSIVSINGMRAALEAAFPEPGSANAITLTNAEYENLVSRSDELFILERFPDKPIKPIAFADRMPEPGSAVHIAAAGHPQWDFHSCFDKNVIDEYEEEITHWLPASALPIPEPAVDAKEEAWKKHCEKGGTADTPGPFKFGFLAGYEAAHAGGAK